MYQSSEGHDSIYYARKYRIYPLAEALTVGISMFIVVALTSVFIYIQAVKAIKVEIREGLEATVSVLSQFIDPVLHARLNEAALENSDLYKQAIMPLRRAKRAVPNISFIYTVILRENKVYFVLDETPPDAVDRQGKFLKSHLMEYYPNATKEMLFTLKKGRRCVEKEPQTDAWGTFISGYAPIKNARGETIAALGIDLALAEYQQRLEPIRRATIRTVMSGFFVAFVVAALVWFMRNFAKVINTKRVELLSALIANPEKFEGEKVINWKVEGKVGHVE